MLRKRYSQRDTQKGILRKIYSERDTQKRDTQKDILRKRYPICTMYYVCVPYVPYVPYVLLLYLYHCIYITFHILVLLILKEHILNTHLFTTKKPRVKTGTSTWSWGSTDECDQGRARTANACQKSRRNLCFSAYFSG